MGNRAENIRTSIVVGVVFGGAVALYGTVSTVYNMVKRAGIEGACERYQTRDDFPEIARKAWEAAGPDATETTFRMGDGDKCPLKRTHP